MRYVRVAAQRPGLVLPVMQMFLRGSGLSHPHDAHATRACYLFMRIVKVLRPKLQDHLEELIQGLIPVVMQIVTHPIQTASHALKATVARGAHAASPLDLSSVKFCLPEVVGHPYMLLWSLQGLLISIDVDRHMHAACCVHTRAHAHVVCCIPSPQEYVHVLLQDSAHAVTWQPHIRTRKQVLNARHDRRRVVQVHRAPHCSWTTACMHGRPWGCC